MIMNQQTVVLTPLQRRRSPWHLVMPVTGLLLLAACASAPPPTLALNAAEQAISTAEKARVADYASPELNSARQNLAAAQAASKDEKMLLAQRLAEQAKADAELATAKAAAAKAIVVNDDMRKSNTILKQEMQRNNSGVTP